VALSITEEKSIAVSSAARDLFGWAGVGWSLSLCLWLRSCISQPGSCCRSLLGLHMFAVGDNEEASGSWA